MTEPKGMEQTTKQRFIGGLVLAAIALIVVPLVFDFSGPGPAGVVRVVVPPPPDPATMKVLPLDEWARPVDPGVPAGEGLSPPATTAAAPVAPTAAPAVPARTPAQAKTGSPTTPAPRNPPASQPLETTPAASPTVTGTASTASPWVVQVASFNAEANARALRDRLRGAGFVDAHVATGAAGGGAVYRVRVGPEDSREAAEALRQQLIRAGHAAAVVMQQK